MDDAVERPDEKQHDLRLVRLQLESLQSLRLSRVLDPATQAVYDSLCARERELLAR